MLPGPIFAVELVTTARRARYFVVRVLYGVILLFALFSVRPSNFGDVQDIATVANFTAAFFSAFAVLQLLAVVFTGPALAAGTIASERERRTIEYLFTTPLSNLEIVLGKLAARLLHAIYLVLVGLPVLALAMMLGGIAPEALVVLMAITLSTVVCVAALSMAVSVWSARAREAVTRAYLVLLALLVVPPLVASLRLMGSGWHWLDTLCAPLLAANPFAVMGGALFEASTTGVWSAWKTVGVLVLYQTIASAAALAAAMYGVRRVHLKQSGTAARRRRWRWQVFRPRVGNAPMLWKELYAEPAAARLGLVGHAALGLILAAVIGITLYQFFRAVRMMGSFGWGTGEEYLYYATTMGTLVSCGGLLLLAARAAGSITSEKERQCWDSLLGTPLEDRSIVAAKLLGNLWAVRGMVVLLAVIWGPCVLLVPSFLVATAFSLATLLICALFVSMVGVMFSLHCRNSLRAMGATLGTLLFVGGGYLFCCVIMMVGGGPGRGSEIILAPCIPFLLAAPGIIGLRGMPPSEEGGFIAAYILGVIGYLAATVVMYLIAIDSFDRITGRTGVRWEPPPVS